MRLLGTPLREERDYKPVWKQEALDERGKRVWFHGAFTGGRSAGYHGTVGSREGWTPATFLSSREARQKAGHDLQPEDFMDEEDLRERAEVKQHHEIDLRLGLKLLHEFGWDGDQEEEEEDDPDHGIVEWLNAPESMEEIKFNAATVPALWQTEYPTLVVPVGFVPRPPSSTTMPSRKKRSMAAALLLAAGDEEDEEEEEKHERAKEPRLTKEQAMAAWRGGYLPFATIPLKQARYQAYLAHQAGEGPPCEPLPGMTPTDWQREQAEFAQTALIFKPLPAPMAAHFVSSNFGGGEKTEAKLSKLGENDGKEIERIISAWRPSEALSLKLGLEPAKVEKPEEQGEQGEEVEEAKSEAPVGEVVQRPPMDLFASIFGDDDPSVADSKDKSDQAMQAETSAGEKRSLRQRPKASDFFK